MGIRLKFFVVFISSIGLALISITLLQSLLSQSLRGLDVSRLEEQYSFYYVLVFILFTSIFYYLFSHKTIRRIEHLNACVNEVGQGNWDIEIHTSINDEIGNLGRQMNAMVASLKELREKELAADNLKTEMIANISHDLRTPVTSLLGYIELMKGNLNDSVTEREKYVQIAERKCLELKSLIYDLLDYSTINSREYVLQIEKVEMKELVQQVMIDFVPQLEAANMNFHIQAPREPLFISVDVGLVVRMLQNLISNAITYGQDEKGLELHLTSNDHEMVLTVVNYGREIPADVLPHIFERFYREEKSRSANTGGKGMGLAICKSIAIMHGGEIIVESHSESTRFMVRLPLES